MRHIGLFGGSFNPVHRGHILAAQSVRSQLKLDEIHFLPAAYSPFKTRPKVSNAHRVEMLNLAIADYPAFRVNTLELEQPGPDPSYTINTLKHIVKATPRERLYLLIGMDAWERFERWHQWRAIIELCHLVVVSRPTYSAPTLSQFWQEKQLTDLEELRESPAGKLVFISVPASEAASSEIRERIRQGQSTNNDLPETVRNYIHEQQLYN